MVSFWFQSVAILVLVVQSFTLALPQDGGSAGKNGSISDAGCRAIFDLYIVLDR